jgi:hypothetical protein
MKLSRRRFLASAGTVLAGSATASSVVAQSDAYSAKPDHVDLVYDRSLLERFRPLLVTGHLEYEPTALYSWVATSPEYDTLVCCYWADYVNQEGLTTFDSHQGDREPVQIFLDKQTLDVERVVVDGHHYIAAQFAPEQLAFDGDQIKLRVVKPWHFYQLTDTAGVNVDLGNMVDKHPTYIANGWSADKRTVTVPWRIRQRGHWWDNSASGEWNRFFYSSLLDIQSAAGVSFRGASASELNNG